MHKLVRHHQVCYPVNIALKAEVLVIGPAEARIDSVVMIHHTSYCIESKAIYIKLLQVVCQIAEQKPQNFILAVVENHAIPRTVVSLCAGVRITMICTVKPVYTVVDIV